MISGVGLVGLTHGINRGLVRPADRNHAPLGALHQVGSEL